MRYALLAIGLMTMTCSPETVVKHPIGSSSDWTFYQTENSPLPGNQVQALAIDGANVKWIGTANGLASFDGEQWKVYNESNSALPSSFITSITIDAAGAVWVGTNKGLSSLQSGKWTVIPFTLGDAITTLHYDSATHTLWTGTERGLVKYKDDVWTRYDDSNSPIELFICSIAVDKDGFVWVGTFDHFNFQGRLWKYDGTHWQLTRLEHKGFPSTFPQALAMDTDNTLWMGISGTSSGGFIRTDGETWNVFDRQATGYPAGLKSMVFSGKSKWFGGGAGLLLYREGDFKIYNSKNSPLPDDFVYSLAADRAGTLWIGTVSGGLASLKERQTN